MTECNNEIRVLGEATDKEFAEFEPSLILSYDSLGNITAFVPRTKVNEFGVADAEQVPSLLDGKRVTRIFPSTIITATGSPNWTIEISNGRARYVCRG